MDQILGEFIASKDIVAFVAAIQDKSIKQRALCFVIIGGEYICREEYDLATEILRQS